MVVTNSGIFQAAIFIYFSPALIDGELVTGPLVLLVCTAFPADLIPSITTPGPVKVAVIDNNPLR